MTLKAKSGFIVSRQYCTYSVIADYCIDDYITVSQDIILPILRYFFLKNDVPLNINGTRFPNQIGSFITNKICKTEW